VEVTSYANLKGASNMNIQFETSQIGQAEAQGLVSLLSSLFPTATAGLVPNGLTSQTPAPKNEEEAIFGAPIRITPASSVPVQAEPVAPTSPSAPAQPEPMPITSKRTRRTKAEMEAAKVQAAPADPTPASAVQTAAASVTTQSVTAPTATVLAPEVRTVSADELRSLLNGYIAKHSMEEAIGQLKAFGCNRVTEALALEPVMLNALAEALCG
jgi:hypothetical protein